MAASFVRRMLSRQTIRYSTFFRSRSHFYKSIPSSLSPKVKTALFGTSLAFLGFGVKKEVVVSEHDQVRAIVSKAIVAKDMQNIKDASEAFHEALTLSTDFFKAERITKEEHMNHRVFIYDLIANMALDNGDFKMAEDVFKETMRLALTLGMSETDNAMMEMSLKIAGIYLFTGRFEIGVIGLKHVIEEQEKKLKDMASVSESKDSKQDESENNNTSTVMDIAQMKENEENTRVLLGQAFAKYGHYYLMKRDFKNAEEMTRKALDISKSVLGETDENTFSLINDLSTCLLMQQEYQKAELLLIEGITKSGEANSVMQAAFLSNLGALYIRLKEYTEAKRACEKGLKVAKHWKDDILIRPCKNCLEKLAEIEELNKKEENDE